MAAAKQGGGTPGAGTPAGSSARAGLAMRGKRDIKSYSLEDLKGMRARGQTQTRADAPVHPIAGADPDAG
jgi:hypothetical protein